jgi:hypothetical protein
MAPIIANLAARTATFKFLLMFVSCFGNQSILTKKEDSAMTEVVA